MGRFEIYTASAGAGKTYTLVKNYLKICLESESNMKFREVLAITFTNKAANEMKDRIVVQLKDFSEYASPERDPEKKYDMLLQLAEELKITPEKLGYRAKEVLSSILHNYSAFSVSTIDKFTNRLIRSFAQDLKLNSNYEVELDSGEMLTQAIDRMLADLEENTATSEVLLQFINTKLDEGKSPRPEFTLLSMGHNLFNEGAVPFLKKLKGIDASKIMEAGKKLQSEQRQIETELKAQAGQLRELIHAQGIESDDFSRGTIYNYINYLYEGRDDKWPPSKTVNDAVEGKSFYAATKAKQLAPKFEPVEDELRRGLTLLVEQVGAIFPRYHLIGRILRDIYSLAVLAEIETNLEVVKEETNRLPIGEFNKLISEKLDNEPTDYLFEKLGERYHYFFIDEFQDTSVLQWKNLLPLINNAMASNGSVMIVGDGKQSIYRWRGGEVSQFIDLTTGADLSNKVRIGENVKELYPRKNIPLGSNYRSRKNVVEFNNDFFTLTGQGLLQGEQFQRLYGSASQNVEKQEGGYVYLKQFEYDAETYADQQCAECLRIILCANKRGYRLSEITVITRRKQESTLLAEYLVKQNVPVVSPDSLIIEQSKSVKALVSFLKFIVRPDDLLGRWDFLNALWPVSGLSGSYSEKHNFLNSLVHLAASEVHKILKDNLEGYDFSELLQLSLLDKVYSMAAMLHLKLQGNPFLHTFIDQVIDYQNNKTEGEAGFLRWWEEKGKDRSINLSEGGEAVKLMTVHKSKGLEFPVTIVPFADWLATREPMGSSAWISLEGLEMYGLPVARIGLSKQDLAFERYQQIQKTNEELVYLDNFNLAYVAFTRAVDELYVLSGKGMHQENTKLTRYISEYFKIKEIEGDSIKVGEVGNRPSEGESSIAKHDFLIPGYPRASWFKKLKISIDAPLNWADGESEQTSYGKRVHSLMAQLREGSEAETILKRNLDQGIIAQHEFDELLPVISGLVKDRALEEYFREGVQVFNEEEILVPGNQSLRPDRVVLVDGRLHILDYKTGAPMRKHRTQVESYRALLAEMGYPDGDNVLIYFGEGPEVLKW